MFISGRDGYHTFRIPVLLVTKGGSVLAWAEGRQTGSGDSGDIDIVMRRSDDGGRTWLPMRRIFDDEANTVGNPCPVVDRETGTIWLFLTRNLGTDTEETIKAGTSRDTRRVWLSRSDDDGRSWSRPADLTDTLKRADWTWYATGPGIGIQTRSGRLIVPCDHATTGTKIWRSHVIYSDDHGRTWRIGGVTGDEMNECQIVERGDGSLLLNMRSYLGRQRRAISTSVDGGLTWSVPKDDPALIEPVCQAALINVGPGPGDVLLFSNPASVKREKMTVQLSTDGGRTWPHARELYAGPSAYSALAVTGDGACLCLYERGQGRPYETITLARFPLDRLQAAPASRPTTGCGQVQVVSRAEWKARPPMADRLHRHTPRLLTIHHAGVLDDGRTPGDQKMRGLLRFSQEEKRWGDVPYHFVIDRSGRVFEGRGLAFAPDTNTDYDVNGHVGICINGDLTRQPLLEAQYRSLVSLLVQLAPELRIADDRIATHQDYARTACPGSLVKLVRDGTLGRDMAACRAGRSYAFRAPPVSATRPGEGKASP